MPRRDLHPAVARLIDEPLSLSEFVARVSALPTEDEIADVAELYAWFTRRYPTAGERLAYVRRAFAAWNRRLEPWAR